MQDNSATISAAVAGLEAWFESVHTPEGYGGPAIGFHHACLAYCGPAFDWRYEGILDGYRRRYEVTKDRKYLQLIQRDLRDIARAQLINATFRASWFEHNPFEGGMPHEPAMLAAACRAIKSLNDAGETVPPEVLPAIQKYIDLYLIHELWNKRLHTFNDWPVSEFQWYSPSSAAAAAELLMEYAALSSDRTRLEPYMAGAVDSIVRLQLNNGAIPVTSRPNDAVSPYLAARCLPALSGASRLLDSKPAADARDKLLHFLKPGRMPRLIPNDRQEVLHPTFIGAVAGTFAVVNRAGYADSLDTQYPLDLIMRNRHATGAVNSAHDDRADGTPEWRDIMPCCGWLDKVYQFLAYTQGSGSNPAPQIAAEIRKCLVNGYPATFHEDEKSIRIDSSRGECLYLWHKGKPWAQTMEIPL